ncbi:hypothetical protein [uncultured Bacteroides sp.]|uniref:hypothetical protein n=1 Tax=uncultured Bacteroides sp. TaxID=162156 RepID=UPI002AA603C7|nr:hypothetical protein [uncultured Bacteroides sp.]
MEQGRTQSIFYMKRRFGDKMDASFQFIKESWKPLLRFTAYLLLPLCLLQAFFINCLMDGALKIAVFQESGSIGTTDAVGFSFWASYIAVLLCFLVGVMLFVSLVYGLMKIYNEGEDEDRMKNISFAEFKPILLTNLKRSLKLFFFYFCVFLIVLCICAALVYLTPWTLVVTLPLLFVFYVPFLLLAPIYLFEKINFVDAFMRTFRLGFITWGGVFLVVLVMGFIAGLLQGVFTTPWYVATVVKFFFLQSNPDSIMGVSLGYGITLYLLAILQMFGAYLSLTFSLTGLAYQYAHASEVAAGITVKDDVDRV